MDRNGKEHGGSAFQSEAFKKKQRSDYDQEVGIEILRKGLKWPASCSESQHLINEFSYDLEHCMIIKHTKIKVNCLFFAYNCLSHGVENNDCGKRLIKLKFQTQTDKNLNSLDPSDERFIEQVLRKGVAVDGIRFSFIGLSNSQLRSKNFYFIRGQTVDVQHLYQHNIFLDFEAFQRKPVSKRVKYKGLLFSGCQSILDLPQGTKVISLDDVEANNYNFTDGCGTISIKLAQFLAKEGLQLQFCPSVWQIRYCGHGAICKGVLVVDYTENDQFVLGFRPSMKKVSTLSRTSNEFSIIDHVLRSKIGILKFSSRQYRIGKMNKQMIALLSASIPCQELLQMQHDFLESIRKASCDPAETFFCSALMKKTDLFNKILNHVKKKSNEEKAVHQFKTLVTYLENCSLGLGAFEKPGRLSLPVLQSITAFGAALPEQCAFLEEGQCCVSICGVNDKVEWVEGDVIVFRSPSYSPGDICVLQAVVPPTGLAMKNLANIILFSTSGERPDADKMSGGDLDGDEYHVSFVNSLTKFSEILRQTANIEVGNSVSGDYECYRSTQDEAAYAARWDQRILGLVDSTFWTLADRYGVQSQQCHELCDIFSRAVDQHSSDLNKLMRLGMEAKQLGNPTKNDGRVTPVWEQMLGIQKELTTKVLEKRKKEEYFDCFGAWKENIKPINSLFCQNRLNDISKIVKSTSLKQISSNLKWISERQTMGSCSEERSIESISQTASKNVEKGRKQCKVQRFPAKAQKVSSRPKQEDKSGKSSPLQSDTKKEIIVHHTHQEVKGSKATGQIPSADQAVNQWLHEDYKVAVEKLIFEIAGCDVSEMLEHLMEQCLLFPDKVQKVRGYERKYTTLSFSLQQLKARRKKFLRYSKSFHDRKEDLENIIHFQEKLTQLKGSIMNVLFLLKQCAKSNELTLMLHYIQDVFQSLHATFPFFSQFCLQCEFSNEYQHLKEKVEVLVDSQHWNGGFFDWVGNLFNKKSLEQRKVQHLAAAARNAEGSCESLNNAIAKQLLDSQVQEEELKAELNKKASAVKAYSESDISAETVLTKEVEVTEIGCMIAYERKQLEKIKKLLCSAKASPQEEDNLPPPLGVLCMAQLSLLNEIGIWTDADASSDKGQFQQHMSVYFRKEKRRFKPPNPKHKPLPILEKRNELAMALMASQVVVMVAETGSGKSTQLPQYLADDMHCLGAAYANRPVRVVCTQPRRVAARELAARVSWEYEEKGKSEVGDLVGFWHGKSRTPGQCDLFSAHRRVSANTRIQFVTEGILLQLLDNNPMLAQFDVVVLDEVHERTKNMDLLLALLRRAIHKLASRIKLVITSASIDPARFCQYFKCEEGHLKCTGKKYDVEEKYKPRPETFSSSSDEGFDDTSDEIIDMGAVIRHCVLVLFENIIGQNEKGDVLIFLEGKRSIHQCLDMIESHWSNTKRNLNEDLLLYPLYSSLSPEDQNNALQQTQQKKGVYTRKVVCCTNIAETSLTIDGVRFVIDSGVAKKCSYSVELHTMVLKNEYISKASAIQRKGRAGRTQEGFCYRLYSEIHYESMDSYETPEILKCPVDELLLTIFHMCPKINGIEELELMDSPSPEALNFGFKRLDYLGFMKKKYQDGIGIGYQITEDGKLAVQLISDFSLQSIRMIINSQAYGCVEEAIQMAAGISGGCAVFEKEMINRYSCFFDELGDFFTYYNIISKFEKIKTEGSQSQWAMEKGLNYKTLKMLSTGPIRRCYNFFKQRKMLSNNEFNPEPIKSRLSRAIVSGYFQNLALLHDEKYMEAGYSLISLGMPGGKLVKAQVGFDSMLGKLGNVVQNTWLCYSNLQVLPSGECLMEYVVRIDINEYKDNSPSIWLEYLGMSSKETKKSNYVMSLSLPHKGSRLIKCLRDKKVPNKIMKECNTKILMLKSSAEICLYGTKVEVESGKDVLLSYIDDIREDIFTLSTYKFFWNYGGYHQSKPLTLGAGFKIKGRNLTICSYYLDDTRLVFFNVPPEVNRSNMNKWLQLCDEDLSEKDVILDHKVSKNLCFLSFNPSTKLTKTRIDQIVQTILSERDAFDSTNCNAKVDRSRLIHLPSQKIYPSLDPKVLRRQYPNLNVSFVHRKNQLILNDSKCPGAIETILMDIQERNLFGSSQLNIDKMIGMRSIGSSICKLKTMKNIEAELSRWLKPFHVKYEVGTSVNSIATIYVYGEPDRRENAVQYLQKKICDEELVFQFQNNFYKLESAYELNRTEMAELSRSHLLNWEKEFLGQAKFELIEPKVDSGRLPQLLVLSVNDATSKKIEDLLRKCLARDKIQDYRFSLDSKCCLCASVVDQNFKQGNEIGKESCVFENNFLRGVRLGLCGCIYCVDCLFTDVMRQCRKKKDSLVDDANFCLVCDQCCEMILPADFQRCFTKYEIKTLCKAAVISQVDATCSNSACIQCNSVKSALL